MKTNLFGFEFQIFQNLFAPPARPHPTGRVFEKSDAFVCLAVLKVTP